MNGNVRIQVSRGSDSFVGLMPAATGMVTQLGPIYAIDTKTGYITIGNAANTRPHDGQQRFQGHQLYILLAAAKLLGFPGGSGCRTFGHKSEVTLQNAANAASTPNNLTLMGPGGVPITYQCNSSGK